MFLSDLFYGGGGYCIQYIPPTLKDIARPYYSRFQFCAEFKQVYLAFNTTSTEQMIVCIACVTWQCSLAYKAGVFYSAIDLDVQTDESIWGEFKNDSKGEVDAPK